MAEQIELGKGGRVGIMIALLVANYKIAAEKECRALLYSMVQMLVAPVTVQSLCVLVLANVAKWICAYMYVGRTSRKALSMMIGTALALEVILYRYEIDGFAGIILRYISAMQMMKMLSYVLAIRECAMAGKNDEKIDAPVLKPGIVAFACYPTLCYQAEYPGAKERSWYNIAAYTGIFVPSALLFYWSLRVMCVQAYAKQDIVERYIDIVIWTNIGWAAGFALTFVSILGLQGEIMMFGDKRYFGAWWDTTVAGYWRRWNSMVHTWIKRHVYKALMKKNITQKTSRIVIFAVSGLVHEHVIGNCIGRRGVGFAVMALQMPIDYIVQGIHKKTGICQHAMSICVFTLVGAPAIAMLACAVI